MVEIRNADNENEDPVNIGGVKQDNDPMHVVEADQVRTNITAADNQHPESSREQGQRKRKRVANKFYNLHNFMRHHDNEPSDIDE